MFPIETCTYFWARELHKTVGIETKENQDEQPVSAKKRRAEQKKLFHNPVTKLENSLKLSRWDKVRRLRTLRVICFSNPETAEIALQPAANSGYRFRGTRVLRKVQRGKTRQRRKEKRCFLPVHRVEQFAHPRVSRSKTTSGGVSRICVRSATEVPSRDGNQSETQQRRQSATLATNRTNHGRGFENRHA